MVTIDKLFDKLPDLAKSISSIISNKEIKKKTLEIKMTNAQLENSGEKGLDDRQAFLALLPTLTKLCRKEISEILAFLFEENPKDYLNKSAVYLLRDIIKLTKDTELQEVLGDLKDFF